jgi:hypothetical protein
MKIICLLFLMLLTSAFCSKTSLAGVASSTVRGRVVIQTNNDSWGAWECTVLLFAEGNPQPVADSTTGSDGLFYFRAIPPGKYRLDIYIRGKLVGTRSIDLTQNSQSFNANGPYLDIPPIEVTVGVNQPAQTP